MTNKPHRVLVTRPAHQAEELCELIEAQGWLPIRFPTIEIQYLNNVELPRLDAYSTLLFTSRNSVDSAFQYWNTEYLINKQLIAIGQATKRALLAHGMKDVISPEGIANSEQLLALEELQMENMELQEILIISGVGGRTLLRDELAKHAKRVDTLALYERRCPCYDKLQIEQVWDTLPDAMVITSNEAAENLKKILNSTPYERSIETIPSVVMSLRNQDYLYDIGLQAKSWVAETTNVYGLISALKQCFDEVDSE